ncbi:hypothetical protein ES703_60297 [subsurface metagenome]
MTLSSDFASWKAKFIEATAKLKLNTGDEVYQREWTYNQGVASDNMHRIALVLEKDPWREDIDAERVRHGKAEEDIIKRWEKRTHPVVTEYNALVKAHEEYLKELTRIQHSEVQG